MATLASPALHYHHRDLEKVFDEDGSGRMDFCEYMLAVQSAKMETPEDKLKWIFRLYDRVSYRTTCLYPTKPHGRYQRDTGDMPVTLL